MRIKLLRKNIARIFIGIILYSGVMPLVYADIYINVMAVNGAPQRKETSVKYNLPGDLRAEDILDTNGLSLEYNVNDGNYFVTGAVALDPKETKTFRVKVRDIWKTTPEQTQGIKNEINNGFEQIGKTYDAQKGQVLKDELVKKLDYITQAQSSATSIEQRIDAYRSYRNEVARIRDQALAVDFWKSNPEELAKEKIVRFNISSENPLKSASKLVKQKQYLPTEVKPQDVVDAQGFEIRFDQVKLQAFLYKEEEIPFGDKKTYTISIRDIWYIPQNDIDYIKKRSVYANDFLKSSKYAESAKLLVDQIEALIKSIETSQAQNLEIKEHISAYRSNQRSLENARTLVENLEKLLALYRETLEKSKVNNVLQKIQSLKGVADISKQIFEKKPTPSTTWNYIGWILLFVGALSVIYLVVLLIRSGANKHATSPPKEQEKVKEEPKK